MNKFDEDVMLPNENNVFNIQPFIEIIKIQISEHVDKEILRFENTVHEVLTGLTNIQIKGKYE